LVYDLGLSAQQFHELNASFPAAQLRRLEWTSFPPHVSDLHVYAWKPIIIGAVVQESNASVTSSTTSGTKGLYHVVFWLDAGCILTDATLFSRFLSRASPRRDPAVWGEGGGGGSPKSPAHHGALLTQSNSKVGALTHQSMLQRFQGEGLVNLWQANGGVLGFHTGSPCVSTILQPWVDCAMSAACIAPPGSNSSNHRWDQAALSMLAHKLGYEFALVGDIGIEVHRDIEAELVILGGHAYYDGVAGARREAAFELLVTMECFSAEDEECCVKGKGLVLLNDQAPVDFAPKLGESGKGWSSDWDYV